MVEVDFYLHTDKFGTLFCHANSFHWDRVYTETLDTDDLDKTITYSEIKMTCQSKITNWEVLLTGFLTLSLLTGKNNVQLQIIWLTAFPLVRHCNVFLINTSLTSHITVIAICLSICSTYWSIYLDAYNVAFTFCCGLVGNTVTIEWTSHVSTRTCKLSHKSFLSETLQVRIHTSFQRFMEIGQIFHNKIFFFWKTVWIILFFQFPGIRNNTIPPIWKASSEENGIGQYPVRMTQIPR